MQKRLMRDEDVFYVSSFDAAYALEVSVFSLQRWFDQGTLKGSKLPGGRRRLFIAGLREFAKKQGYDMPRFEARLKEALAQARKRKRG
jgi:hypothetical protein